jgi:hypothetical protein
MEVGGQGLGGAAGHPCGGADEKVGSRRESECGRDVEVAGEVFHEWDGDRGGGSLWKELFERNRGGFGEKRKSGARKVWGCEGGLCSKRDLKLRGLG